MTTAQPNTIPFITPDIIEDQITWPAMVEAIRIGHLEKQAVVDDMLLADGDNRLLTRAAWAGALGIAVKSVTIYPKNPSLTPALPSIDGAVLLFEPETGALEAIMDGIMITKWKTAADSVLGASLLARPDARHLSILGAGKVARTLIDSYLDVFATISKVTIWNRTQTRAIDLARHAQVLHPHVTFAVAETAQEACMEGDIISSATMSKRPFIEGDWIKPGSHVDLIGAFTPDMREATDSLLKKSRLFVDSLKTTIGHIGEIQIPLDQGVITQANLEGDFYDYVVPHRITRKDDDITLFKNGGGAHLDLMIARAIFEIWKNHQR